MAKMVKFVCMTLKPGTEQKKWKQKASSTKRVRKTVEVSEMPKLTDKSDRTPEDLFPDWKKIGATLREVHFAAEYLTNGFNATKAWIVCTGDVFRKIHTQVANNRGSDMLRNVHVQQLISDYTTAWLRGKAYELEHNVLETLEAMAFSDISMFLNPDGSPKFKSWDEIPPTLRRCIDGMERKFYGRDANRSVLNITLAKRSDALKAIANYVALMRNGPLAQNSNATQMSPDTELLLASVLNGGRKVDRRTPAQMRSDKQKELDQVKDQDNGETVAFSGLG